MLPRSYMKVTLDEGSKAFSPNGGPPRLFNDELTDFINEENRSGLPTLKGKSTIGKYSIGDTILKNTEMFRERIKEEIRIEKEKEKKKRFILDE
eukprot:CAMPEP_0202963008 /NCGR_PEP_ID=MMETSP1396-20130829/7016_1 /ASSEMBLY_ACC=CAM_ASM_000872 /TAXON_ID= /ORGANISM="Pseudokeronopsis sp., Strain Brazil" /LENGTH=93 /DNA_ID=CAMNT_0049683899 /DNA_START=351 /DNA_END=632 /DNA_ORIENTATION=-